MTRKTVNFDLVRSGSLAAPRGLKVNGKPKEERRESDDYQTPQPLADAICARLAEAMTPRTIIEPGAGIGNFVHAAHKAWDDWEFDIAAIEIREECRAALEAARSSSIIITDWAKFCREGDPETGVSGPQTISSADLILGNPAYRFASEHILAPWPHMAPGAVLAFLLDLNFLGSAGRWEGPLDSSDGEVKTPGVFRTATLASYAPIIPRPDFSGAGGARTEYALFTFIKGWTHAATLDEPIYWEKE